MTPANPLEVAPATVPRLGVFETLSLVVKMAMVVPYTFFRVSRQLLTAKHSQPLLVRIRNAVIIWIMGKLSWRQIHAAMPGTLATYLAWMKRRGLKAHVTQLEGSSDGVQGKGFEDARILWVGEEWSEDKDGKVLLYFHGGGYIFPMRYDHMTLMEYFKKTFECSHPGQKLYIAMLEYKLIPVHRFPTQLSQAAFALHHLLEKLHLPPSSLVIGGDSAGANLTIALLSHILHPHPDIRPVELPSPLAGMLLISPVTTFSGSSASYITNAETDYITQSTAVRYGQYMTDDSEYYSLISERGLYYGEFPNAPLEWWDGMERVTNRILVTTGECEVLRDETVALADIWRKTEAVKMGLVECEVRVESGEVHDEPLMDFGIGGGGRGGGKNVKMSTSKCAEFLGSCLDDKLN